MGQKLKYALIGAGVVGKLRAEAIVAAGSKLARVSDVNAAAGQALAQQFDAQFEPDWRRAIADGVDVVVVSTPPPLHPEMCIESLRAGRHVLCEKPLARTPEDCDHILEAAKASGRFLATGFNYRFYPAIKKAREILDSGGIGELDHVRSYAGHPGGKEFSHSWVHDAKVMAGGALVDNGIHILDLTQYFLGEVAEAHGFISNRVWQFDGCEDNAMAVLRSTEGKMASLHASWTEWRGYGWRIEIYGTKGCVTASYPPMMTQVRWRDSGKRSTHLFPLFQVRERLRGPYWTVLQSFVEEFAEFERAAAGEPSRIASGLDGMRAVRIAHTVYRESAEKAAVPLPSGLQRS